MTLKNISVNTEGGKGGKGKVGVHYSPHAVIYHTDPEEKNEEKNEGNEGNNYGHYTIDALRDNSKWVTFDDSKATSTDLNAIETDPEGVLHGNTSVFLYVSDNFN